MGNTRQVAVIMVAFGAEPDLHHSIDAVLASRGVDVHLTIVDNGCSNPLLGTLTDPRVTVLRPGSNTGFTGGCNLAGAQVDAPIIVFVNSDAVVADDALYVLAHALDDPGTGLVCAKILLRDDPQTINSAGNPVHYSLLSWAGHWGDKADLFDDVRPVASITGCVFAIRTADWAVLGGFHEELFAYGEDVELSLRTWLAGRRVLVVPAATAEHSYDFTRNPRKMYWLERNRLANMLTLYQSRSLLVLAPILLALEAGLIATAARSGWLPAKLEAYGWVWHQRRHLRERRRLVQSGRQIGDRELFAVLSEEITPSPKTGMAVPVVVNRILRGYGRRSRRLLHSSGGPLVTQVQGQRAAAVSQTIPQAPQDGPQLGGTVTVQQ